MSSNSAYYRHLKRLYEKANAAWRREMRKNPKPCEICGDENAECMAEGNWLCREHKAQWKLMLPYKSYAQRLDDMGYKYPTEEQFNKGLIKIKQRKLPDPAVKPKGIWEIGYKPRAKAAPRKKK